MRGGSSPPKGGQAAQALGRSRGGFSTKIHVSVDGLGNPLRFILTGGQQHDITQAEELIAGYAGEHVLADKGYDAQEFRQHILELGMMPVIPPRSNRKLDFVHLRGVGEDVGELSVNCDWGFSAVGFQPRQWNMSVGQPQHEVRRFGHVSNFCTKSRQGARRL